MSEGPLYSYWKAPGEVSKSSGHSGVRYFGAIFSSKGNFYPKDVTKNRQKVTYK